MVAVTGKRLCLLMVPVLLNGFVLGCGLAPCGCTIPAFFGIWKKRRVLAEAL